MPDMPASEGTSSARAGVERFDEAFNRHDVQG